MLGKLQPNEIEHLLSTEIVGRLGCYADNRTYIVPVSYAYADNAVFIRSLEGKKLDMMRKNPSVCFQVDSLQDMGNWKSVVAWGIFEELTNPDERLNALQHLMNRKLPVSSSEKAHLTAEWPFGGDRLEDVEGIVFRINLSEKSGRFEVNQPASCYAS